MTDNARNRSKPEFWFWLTTAGGVLLMAFVLWKFDVKWLHDHVQQLNGFLVFALLAVLPLFGVPVSALFVATGAKFGPGWGMVVTAGAIAFHLLASWWIAHSWLKRPLKALLRKFGRQQPEVPRGEYVSVCLFIALVPGASYTLKNYLLVLANIPGRPYFWTLLPAHLVHASLAIVFGDFTGAMTGPKIVFLCGYAVVLLGLSHRLFRRMKRRTRTATEAGAEPRSQATTS